MGETDGRQGMKSGAEAVTIVTVSYRSADVLGGLLTSVDAQSPIVVVDNADDDATAALVGQFGNALLIRQARNTGFGAANNTGVGKARTPYVLLLNPDARLADGCLGALIDAAQRYGERCVFNPAIRDEAGRPVLREGSRFLGRHAPRPGAPGTGDLEVDVLSGAAIFMRRADYEAIGGFDEEIFLFFEDDDLSLRLLAQGYRLLHIAGATVHHASGQATPPSAELTRFKNYHWMRSYRYVSAKHGYPFARTGEIGLAAWRWVLGVVTGNSDQRAKYAGRLQALIETPASHIAKCEPKQDRDTT